jgi:oligopeptide/dipeptide ABC transporter ATP-binding protein
MRAQIRARTSESMLARKAAESGSQAEPLCVIESLSVRFPMHDGRVLAAVDDVTLHIRRGETVGIVGESGSGKTMLGLSLLGLVPAPGAVSGRITVAGIDVVGARRRQLYELRGRKVGLVLQDPTASLNPFRTIRSQLAESLRRVGVTGTEADTEMRSGLERVRLDPAAVLRRRPFELSGGMNQRIAIAMAILQRPDILVADEPTTALDVVVQLEVLELLRELQREQHMALVLISHDLAVVDQLADRIAVMYGGKLVELGPADEIVSRPSHPYTSALLAAMPDVARTDQQLRPIPGQFRQIFTADAGCPLVGRCDHVREACGQAFPERLELDAGHAVWCWSATGERVRS